MSKRTPEQHKASDEGPEERVPFRERLACSVNDAQVASGISRSQLYLEMKKGNLEFLKRGTRRLIRVSSLLRLIE